MRRLASLLAAVVAVALLLPGEALADPSQVYQDFVVHGSLSCKHSRSDLASVVSSATLNQYSDQATMTDLKIAVQRAIVAGCYIGGVGKATASGPAAGAPAPTSIRLFAAVGGGILLVLAAAGVVVRRALARGR